MDQMFPAHTCALLLLLSPSVVSDSVWPHGQKPARLLCPGIFEGRILEWVAIPFFRGSSWLKVQNHVSCTTGRFYIAEFISVQFSHSVMSNSWRPHELQHARPPCPSPTPRVHPNPCPLSQWCHPLSHPLLSPSPPALSLSQHQGLLQWVSSSHQVAKVLEFQLQHQSFQWTPRTDLP